MKFYIHVMFLLSVVPSVQCAVFATPSWMHTASRNLEGRSLTATSAEDFKKKQLAAAAAEGKVVPLAATGAVAMTGIGVSVGADIYTKNENHKYRLLAPFITGAGMVASAAVYAANIPGALKRKKMHELHAKHADVLYALLQSTEFKKKMGVESWESVRRRRKKAEAIGLSVQTIGSVLAFFVMVVLDRDAHNKRHCIASAHPYGILTASGEMLLPLLIGLGAKPLIARLIRKKGGVEQLNREFAKAIAAAEAQKKQKHESISAVDAEPVRMVSS
jgi:hypothetical protein